MSLKNICDVSYCCPVSVHERSCCSTGCLSWLLCGVSFVNDRGSQRLSAFAFHWSKHHSNIVPPMTAEQQWFWTSDVEQKASRGGREGRRWAAGGGGSGKKSALCFGLRLQTEIGILQHVQPVVFFRCPLPPNNSGSFWCSWLKLNDFLTSLVCSLMRGKRTQAELFRCYLGLTAPRQNVFFCWFFKLQNWWTKVWVQ